MKKIILLLSFVASVTLTQAQNETIYLETCGASDVSANTVISLHTGWDVGAPVVYSSTGDVATVRSASSLSNHIWFAANKDVDFIINNISGMGYTNLKLSFDVAANRISPADANAVAVYVNDVQLQGIPSYTFLTLNVFYTVADLPIPNADLINLKFAYTTISNPTAGFRLDNFKITGDKVPAGLLHTSADVLDIKVVGKKLTVINGQTVNVEIYSTLGVKIATMKLVNGSADINLSKGLYIVRSGKKSAKIIL